MLIQIIALIVLIVLSGVFSSTETAFTSLSVVQIEEIEKKRGSRGRLVKKLTDRPDILLTTILIGNNLVNIGASALATQITIHVFGNQAVGIMTGILTLIILIFAEVTPKRLAIVFNEKFAVTAARFITFLSWVFRPFIFFIGLISNSIARLFRAKKKVKVTLEGILHMINLGEYLGVVKRYETRMVRSVFRFNDITVQAIMTHRTEVFSLEMNETLGKTVGLIIQKGYSRIPVYNVEPEKVAGIVLLRDIMKYLAEKQFDVPLKEIMIEPIFVPQTKMVNEMFAQFKREKLNMAIVLDEYGGLGGVVTLEDVIEEILGDVYDEHEWRQDEKIKSLGSNQYLISADISLHQLYEGLNIELQSEKYAKTLGGYLINFIDYIPEEGEEIEIKSGKFIIEKIIKNRIITVRYIPKPKCNVKTK
jgi:CBS domain containing-hemolysin-like protein